MIALPDDIETIPNVLAFWAERAPDAPALIVPGCRVISYGDLWGRAGVVAATVAGAGMRRGERVALLIPDEADLAVAVLGTTMAAIAAPLPASPSDAELAAALPRLRAAAAIVTPSLPASTRDVLARNGIALIELAAEAPAATGAGDGATGEWPAADRPQPPDIAFAFQTSGITGVAKWMATIHGGVVSDSRARCHFFGIGNSDRGLATSPLHLSLGLTMLLHTIVAGAAPIFPTAPGLPGLWQTIVAEQPTWMFTSAGLVELLV
jgi:acyl-CoA synthetase (AMP-forming)/AMP-acid ligase II